MANPLVPNHITYTCPQSGCESDMDHFVEDHVIPHKYRWICKSCGFRYERRQKMVKKELYIAKP